MDLFDSIPLSDLPGTPLAEKKRPRKLADFVGHAQIIKQVEKYLKNNSLPNLILFGPSGVGKTTFAKILASEIKAQFISLNAVESGAKQLKEIGDAARTRRREHKEQTIVFIDEIHRFNKAQQDVLLGFIETGDIVLIGATTENPSYELNRALLSRCRVLRFAALTQQNLQTILGSTLKAEAMQTEKTLTPEAISRLFDFCDGDARKLLMSIEEIISEFQFGDNKVWPLDATAIGEIIGKSIHNYGKKSGDHFDILSALIKSLRGSDADSAMLYFAYMIQAGEDPRLIARRLIVCASEDIGNADPKAMEVAVAGLDAFEAVGLPEGAYSLAQVITYLASAPKSNRSYSAYKKAVELLASSPSLEVPAYLQNNFSKQKIEIEKAGGIIEETYKYPHSFPKNWVAQNYWPVNIEKQQLYEPSDSGFEKKIKEYKAWQQGAKES